MSKSENIGCIKNIKPSECEIYNKKDSCANCGYITGIEPKEEVMTGVKAVSILKEQVYKFNSQKIILTQTEALHLLNYIDILKIKIKEQI